MLAVDSRDYLYMSLKKCTMARLTSVYRYERNNRKIRRLYETKKI